jgi:hypothetical protein
MTQVKILSCTERFLDERLREWQKDGWEIAGSIETKHNDQGYTMVYIPMKKEYHESKKSFWSPGWADAGGGL